MGPFNNREVASAFWLLVFAVWILQKPNVRKSLGGALRAFCHPKVLAPVCLMLLYVVGIVTLLATIGIWTVDLLKDTIIWFFVGEEGSYEAAGEAYIGSSYPHLVRQKA